MEEHEGAADTNLAGVIYILVPMGALDAQNLGIEIYGDIGRRGGCRFYPDPGARFVVPDFQRFGDVDVFSGNALVLDAVSRDGFDIETGAAVQDGHFYIVQFNDGIVNAQAREGAHQVLDGDHHGLIVGDGGAAGRIGDILRDGLDDRLGTEVRAAEYDACIGRGRHHLHVRIGAGMEAFSLEIAGLFEGMLIFCHS